MVLRKLLDLTQSPWKIAVVWLLIGAIFFAMQSCEYLDTNTPEEDRRTKLLRLRNIIFKKNGITIPHPSPYLEESDIVMIIFEFQKNYKEDIQVNIFRTSDDILNPVIAWAKTVKRIWSYPGAAEDSKVCMFMNLIGFICNIKADDDRD